MDESGDDEPHACSQSDVQIQTESPCQSDVQMQTELPCQTDVQIQTQSPCQSEKESQTDSITDECSRSYAVVTVNNPDVQNANTEDQPPEAIVIAPDSTGTSKARSCMKFLLKCTCGCTIR